MQTIEGFDPSMLWTFVIVAIGLCSIAVLVLNLITKIREVRKPKEEKRDSVDDAVHRIDKLEKIMGKQSDEMKLLMTGEMAILHHMIDGNHTESLKESQKQIEYFLTYGKIPD